MRQIFVSSVRNELQAFRFAVRNYIHDDPLLANFFSVFLFEDRPAADRRADDVYLDEVAKSDIYLGLFGNEYGREDAQGLSPTHREFDAASENRVERLVFVIDLDGQRHAKMRDLITQASGQLIRRRVRDIEGLKDGLYASLVEYLGRKGGANAAGKRARIALRTEGGGLSLRSRIGTLMRQMGHQVGCKHAEIRLSRPRISGARCLDPLGNKTPNQRKSINHNSLLT